MGVDANSISIAAPINERTGFIPYSSPARNSGSFVIDPVPTAVGEPPGLGPQPIVSILCGVNRPFQSFGTRTRQKTYQNQHRKLQHEFVSNGQSFLVFGKIPPGFPNCAIGVKQNSNPEGGSQNSEFRSRNSEFTIRKEEPGNSNDGFRTNEPSALILTPCSCFPEFWLLHLCIERNRDCAYMHC
jgi:hypothetical protein